MYTGTQRVYGGVINFVNVVKSLFATCVLRFNRVKSRQVNVSQRVVCAYNRYIPIVCLGSKYKT